MPTTPAEARPKQEPGTPSGPPTWVAGTQILQPSSASQDVYKGESGSEVE